jgi:tRNA(Ile)-lysidine synthase
MPKPITLPLEEQHLRPGLRLGVAVSGGADSVALLLALLARRESLGLVLAVVHVHHGLRGAEADRDRDFVHSLAAAYDLPLHLRQVDVPARVQQNSETVEEAARHLRYAFFHNLLEASQLDAIATAHTLDDQAETVLQKLLRGAWTEGLGGVSPVVKHGQGSILRPLLNTTRVEVEAYLKAIGQSWCEDSTNLDTAYTRNRVRHELLPALRGYNPQISGQLARLATIARDEEAYWHREIARMAPALVLPGKPVRGGGRSSSTHPEEASIAVELDRLRTFPPAVQRRLLRWFVQQIGGTLDFEQTDSLLQLAGNASATTRRLEINGQLYVQRTAREVQFIRQTAGPGTPSPEMLLPIPGQVDMPEFGLRFTASASSPQPPALIRGARPGDRVTQRYSRGPKKIKEILERSHLSALERQSTPVVTWPATDPKGLILWLRGVELDPASLPALPFVLEVAVLPAE